MARALLVLIALLELDVTETPTRSLARATVRVNANSNMDTAAVKIIAWSRRGKLTRFTREIGLAAWSVLPTRMMIVSPARIGQVVTTTATFRPLILARAAAYHVVIMIRLTRT